MDLELSYIGAKVITTALFALPGLFALLAPELAAKVAIAFPRNRYAGMALSTIAFAWAAAIIWFQPLDFLVNFKDYICLALLVSIPLSWKWIPELLAARALGAVWCLIPAPVLVASRFADGDGRLLIVSLMYVTAVAGMFTTFSPYLLRNFIAFVTKKGERGIRIYGAISALLGIATLIFA